MFHGNETTPKLSNYTYVILKESFSRIKNIQGISLHILTLRLAPTTRSCYWISLFISRRIRVGKFFPIVFFFLFSKRRAADQCAANIESLVCVLMHTQQAYSKSTFTVAPGTLVLVAPEMLIKQEFLSS